MPSYITDSARWTALSTRDPLADNMFVYSVTSTGIYCRPTCPSRLARRANVVFYNTASAAEMAGYRPCKRCSPHVVNTTHSDSQKATIEQACVLMRKCDQGPLTVKDVAQRVGLSESHFSRAFKKHVGCTAGQYMARVAEGSSGGGGGGGTTAATEFGDSGLHDVPQLGHGRHRSEGGASSSSRSPSTPLATPPIAPPFSYLGRGATKTDIEIAIFQLQDDMMFEEFIDYPR